MGYNAINPNAKVFYSGVINRSGGRGGLHSFQTVKDTPGHDGFVHPFKLPSDTIEIGGIPYSVLPDILIKKCGCGGSGGSGGGGGTVTGDMAPVVSAIQQTNIIAGAINGKIPTDLSAKIDDLQTTATAINNKIPASPVLADMSSAVTSIDGKASTIVTTVNDIKANTVDIKNNTAQIGSSGGLSSGDISKLQKQIVTPSDTQVLDETITDLQQKGLL
jgi:hypothetical protein